MTSDQLRKILEDLVNDPKMVPHDTDGVPGDETFCNIAVQRICVAFGFKAFEGMLANDMLKTLESGKAEGWKACTGEEAAAHALSGGLAVAGKRYEKHGHIAVVWPGSMDFSPSFGKMVPMLANVGGRDKNGVPMNGVKNMGWFFSSKKGEPGYWKFKQGE